MKHRFVTHCGLPLLLRRPLLLAMMMTVVTGGAAVLQAQSVNVPSSKTRVRLVIEPKEEGFIKVGTPQVYSRQTVFRDRAEEIQYLSDRLKAAKDLPETVQGIIDARDYRANAFQAAMKFDPLTGRLTDQTNANDLRNLQQQGQLSETRNRIELERAEANLAVATRQLQQVQAGGPVPGDPVADQTQANKVSTLEGKVKTLEEQVRTLREAAVKAPAPEDNRVRGQATKDGGKPSPIDSVALTEGGIAGQMSKAQTTLIEKEKAVLEVRRFLQNERRKLSFDSGHDASAEVAMDMAMMVTIMPPRNVEGYAVVEAFVEAELAPLVLQEAADL
ncbi:MAG: hypothetical protein ACO1TE_23865, partial [Prosthecobacter sp.]